MKQIIRKGIGIDMICNTGMWKDNEKYWFVGKDDNILYCMDQEFKVSIEEALPPNNEKFFSVTPRCMKIREFIVCLPDRGNQIYVYDEKEKVIKFIDIESAEGKEVGIVGEWFINGFLWCIALGTKKIYKINISKFCVVKEIEICALNEDIGYEAVQIKGCIYCVSLSECVIYIFDTQTEQMRSIKIKCEDKGFNTIVYDDGKLFLTGYSNNIYCWDIEKEMLKTYSLPVVEVMNAEKRRELNENFNFMYSCALEDYIVFIPFYTWRYGNNKVYYLNKKDELITSLDYLENYTERNPGDLLVLQYTNKNTVVIQDYRIIPLISINLESKEIDELYMAGDLERNKLFWNRRKMDGQYKENMNCQLEHLVSNIQIARNRDEKTKLDIDLWKALKEN